MYCIFLRWAIFLFACTLIQLESDHNVTRITIVQEIGVLTMVIVLTHVELNNPATMLNVKYDSMQQIVFACLVTQ